MKPLVIESPYAPRGGFTLEENVAFARAVCRYAVLHGFAPYASHLFYSQPGVLDDTVPAERELGIQAGFVWGGHAAEVWFCVRHDEEQYSGSMMQSFRHWVSLERQGVKWRPTRRHLVFTPDGALLQDRTRIVDAQLLGR